MNGGTEREKMDTITPNVNGTEDTNNFVRHYSRDMRFEEAIVSAREVIDSGG
jgi:hypothetical protein